MLTSKAILYIQVLELIRFLRVLTVSLLTNNKFTVTAFGSPL